MKYLYRPFLKMFDFKGRATRKEHWYFFLFKYLFFAIMILGNVYRQHFYLFLIALIPLSIASLSLGFRRLRDAGFPAWLFLFLGFMGNILAAFPSKEIDN